MSDYLEVIARDVLRDPSKEYLPDPEEGLQTADLRFERLVVRPQGVGDA